jgi:hypothetical protein
LPHQFITDKNLDAPHPFEILFIIFAVAFALEEYTASRQHGWISECRYHDTLSTLLIKCLVYIANVRTGPYYLEIYVSMT